MNNDNRPDLIVANYYNSSVGTLYGYGDGTFSAVKLQHMTEGFRPRSIVLVDLNNDGQLDIVVVNAFFDAVQVVVLYSGEIAQDQVISSNIASSQPQLAVVADFNNDNQPDIAFADYSSPYVAIMLSNGNLNFAPLVYYSTGSGSVPISLNVGDFNNDNILDIVLVSIAANDIVILFGVGNGTFLLGRAHSTGFGSGPNSLVVGDFNNDTRLDIAVTNLFAKNMAVFLGDDNEPLEMYNYMGQVSDPSRIQLLLVMLTTAIKWILSSLIMALAMSVFY